MLMGWLAGGLIGGLVGALAGGAAVWALARAGRGPGAGRLAKLREAERRAAAMERMAEVGAMTAGLAHEIKNPLSTIGMNAQLVAEGLADLRAQAGERHAAEVDRLSRRVGTLARESERLGSVLGEFLDFAGEMKLSKEPADLRELLEEMADFMLPRAERSGVRVRVVGGEGGVVAPVDRGRVKQALLNLMLNGVQAMEREEALGQGKGRELLLGAEAGPMGPGGGVAWVRVTDTGPGIEPGRLSRIFEPYYTTKPGGTGLGLPIARRVAEAHGGRLLVTSEVGLGTSFTLELPLGEGA